MARKKRNRAADGGATWLDTYADTITLLMTFFVLLYSMSSVDSQKLKEISNAFNSIMTGKTADSILEYNLYNGDVPLVGGEAKDESTYGEYGAGSTYADVKTFVSANELADVVEITEDSRGIVLALKDSILFEIGKADLKDNSKKILDKINILINTLPNEIIIEGHTDNVPIKTYQFDSNWDLSVIRATSVLKYFTQQKGQPQGRFSATGYGETKPLLPNTSEENRAKNRRVNILLVTNKGEDIDG